MTTLIPQSQRVPLSKTKVNGVEYPGYIERAWYEFICRQVVASNDEIIADIAALNAELDAVEADVAQLQADVAAIDSPKIVDTTVDFGASFSDKASFVVTGQTWVTASSVITPTVMCPAGVDTDEMRLLDMRPVISDKVAGVGFTVTLYSEPEARGTYTVSCVGV